MAICVVLIVAAAPAWAGVLHDDNEVPLSERPADAVLGRWGSNASCVAIGPSHVLTTTHQGNSSTVVIDGVTYTPTTSAALTGGSDGSSDIRIAELTLDGQPANLPYWVDLYTGATGGETAVLGGYGKGRGSVLTTSGGVPYGYAWSSDGNTTLRWGQNLLSQPIGGRLIAYFDGPDAPNAAPYEAAVAQFDSGGGWFIADPATGEWGLAGLTTGAEHAGVGQSWFKNTAGRDDPDRLEALRLQLFAPWIDSMMAPLTPIAGDNDRDGDIDYDDLVALAANYGRTGAAGWAAGNFDGDGDVDLVDLGMLAANYGVGVDAPLDFGADLASIGPLPEPDAGALAALAAAIGLRRRRRIAN